MSQWSLRDRGSYAVTRVYHLGLLPIGLGINDSHATVWVNSFLECEEGIKR